METSYHGDLNNLAKMFKNNIFTYLTLINGGHLEKAKKHNVYTQRMLEWEGMNSQFRKKILYNKQYRAPHCTTGL